MVDRRRGSCRRRWLSVGLVLVLAAQSLVACSSNGDPDPDDPVPPTTDAIGGLPAGEGPTPSGGYQRSIPLELPPYYGITPAVRLTYDSRGVDGWLGAGWRLDGLSTIRRLGPGRGVPTYSAVDSFYLDGAELVPCGAGTPGPSCAPASRLEDPFVGYAARADDYRRYAFDPRPTGGWQVWEKNGTRYTFRARAGQAGSPAAWDLAEVSDTSGHTVRYQYLTETPAAGTGETYPERMSYGGIAVDFHYRAREDALAYGDGRGLVTSSRLLATLDVKVGDKRVRAYRFSYRVHPPTGRSALTELRQFGSDVELSQSGEVIDPTLASALPPTTFLLDESNPDRWALTEAASDEWGVPLDGGPPVPVVDGVAFVVPEPFFRLQPSNLGDLDGNGRTDWVQATPDLVFDPTGRHTKVLVTAAVAGRGAPVYTQEELAWPYGNAVIKTTLMGDVDADGRADLVFVLGRKKISGEEPYWASYYLGIGVARSTGDGHFTWLASTLTETPWESRERTNRVTHCTLGDVDGDARQDVLCSFTRGDGSHHLGTATSNGDGGFTVREEPAPFAVQGETRLLAVGDTDGDGLADAMFLDFPHCPDGEPGCTVQYEMVTALSAGDRYAAFEREKTPWDRGNPPRFFAADINGDGRDDYVVLKNIAEQPDGPGAVQTAYRGYEGKWVLSRTVVPAALNRIPNSVSVGDADADGDADLLVVSRQEPGRPGCGSGYRSVHVNLHRVLSRGNGTFALPASWEDCSRSRELDIAWSDIGYTPVEPQAADLDGDRTADFLIATAQPDEQFTTLRANLSGPVTKDVMNWRAAELNGDGRSDWVFIRNTPTGPLVASMLSNARGYTGSGHSPVPGTSHFTVQDGWRVADFNADGTDDLVYLEYSNRQNELVVGTWSSQPGGGWNQRTVSTFAGLAERHRNTLDWQPADINGDGRLDLLYIDRADTGTGLATWSLLSNGDGTWTEAPGKTLPGWPADATNRRTTDVNGDGRTDLQYITATAGAVTVHTAIGTGDGTWRAAARSPAVWKRKPGDGLTVTDRRAWWSADINGDGLGDIFTLTPTTRDPKQPFELRVLTLLGHGDGGYTGRDQPQPVGHVTGDMPQWRTASVSGSQRAELVHVRVAPPAIVVTTLTWSHDGTWFLSSPDINVNEASRDTSVVGNRNRFMLADVDGDGRDDLTRFDLLPAGMRLVSAKSSIDRNLLVRVKTPDGATTTVEYATRAQLTSASTSARCHLPARAQPVLVRSIRVTAGSGAAGGTATYEYECPVWSYARRMFLGWRDVFTHRPTTGTQPAATVHRRHQLSDKCLVQNAYTETLDDHGRVLTKRIVAPAPPGDTAPFTCAQPVYIDDIVMNSGGTAMNVYAYFHYDDYGNVTHVYEHGAGGQHDGDERTTLIVYRPAPGPYIVGLPHQQVSSEGVQPIGAGQRYTYYCYDGDNGTAQSNCAGTITNGLLTATKVVNPNGWYDTTVYRYDKYGNVEHIIDADGRDTTYGYDGTYHRFPASVCDPDGRCSTITWDPGLAQVTSTVDADNLRTDVRYDIFGRLWQILPQGRAATEYTYLDIGDPTRQRVRVALDDGTEDGLWSQTYLDGLGRPYRDVREGSTPGTTVVRDTVYSDANTTIAQQSSWHANDVAATLESYRYDALSRPVNHHHADGAEEQWSYDNDTTRTITQHTGETGKQITVRRDAYGRTTGTSQPTAAGLRETEYGHDVVNQVRKIDEKAPPGSSTALDWDVRGDLRQVTNPDGGTVILDEYLRTGRVRRIIDAHGGWTRLTYDKSGRLQSRTTPSGREIDLYYNEAGHGPSGGQVTSVTDTREPGCPLKVGFGGYLVKELFYDDYGRLERTKQCVDGRTVALAFTYDELDRVRTMTYPDGEHITYGYDASGRIKSVSGYANEIHYDAAGRVVQLDLSNETTQTYHYNAARPWLDRITVTNTGGSIFDLGYTRHGDGFVKATTSSTNQGNFGYTYDPAGQLTDVTGDVVQQFAYDSAGNMTINSALGAYTYDAPSGGGAGCGTPAQSITCPHAVKHVGPAELVYDRAGNLTSIKNGSGAFPHLTAIEWDKDMQPATLVDNAGVRTRLRYDENGQRTYRNRADRVSLYFDPYVTMDYTAGQNEPRTTQFYFAGNLLLAEKDANGKTWYHSDQIGSTRATTNGNGTAVARFDYGPYGQPLGGTAADAQDRRYAGHRTDPDNDLVYMGARHYAPSIGRFISPDPVVPDTFRPMATNRYAYAYNNPLAYVDPLGLGSYGLGIEERFTMPSGGIPSLGMRSVLALAPAAPPAMNNPSITALASSYAPADTAGGAAPGPASTPPETLSEETLAQLSRSYLTGQSGCPVCHTLEKEANLRDPTTAEKVGIGLLPVAMLGVFAAPVVGEIGVGAGGWTALDTASTWLFLRAPTFFTTLLTVGNALVGVPSGPQATSAQSAGTHMALGVKEHLDDFAAATGGMTYTTWGGNEWRLSFLNLLRNPTTRISFNLTGVPGGAWGAVARAAAKGLGGHATDWELLMIKNNADALSRTIFYMNGQPVPSPF